MLTNRPYYDHDAPWRDAQWFSERPERQYRLRPMYPSEYNSFGGSTHILVKKIGSIERQRLPVLLLAVPAYIKARLQSDSPVAPDIEAVLAEMFVAVLTGRTLDLRRVLRNGLENFGVRH